MEFEEFKKSFDDIFKNYYNEYFAAQTCIESVYLELMRDCMKSLLVTYCSFLLLLNSMKYLKNDRVFYKKCSNSRKVGIKDSICCLEALTDDFARVLSAYSDGLTD